MSEDLSSSGKGSFTVKQLAHELRKHLLTLENGAFVGHEEDLVVRWKVSRPTFRQAARILEHDQLLSVRRGPRGGYYACRPDPASVINAAALYLHGRGARLRDTIAITRGCMADLIRLAAGSKDEAAREALRAQLAAYIKADFPSKPHGAFLRAENEILSAIARLAANPTLELIIKILYGCGLEVSTEKIFENRPDRIAAHVASRVKVLESLLAGDAEVAVLHHLRSSDQRLAWTDEDEARAAQRKRRALAAQQRAAERACGDEQRPAAEPDQRGRSEGAVAGLPQRPGRRRP